MEVSLLIKREKSDKNWLKQLQIKIPEKTIHLDIIKNFKKNNYTTENKIKLQNAILYVENQSNRIVVFTKYPLSEEDTIACFDKFGIKTKNYEYLEINEKTYAFNSQDEEIFKIAIERNSERISNFSLIHNALNLIKTNPNQVNAELEALLNSDFSENNGLTDLLKYVETDWADETSLQVKTNFTSISKVGVKSAKDEIEKEYEIIEYEEFNQKDLTSFYRKFAILQNPNLKIADFFNALAKGLDSNSQFIESEELKLVIDNDAENNQVSNLEWVTHSENMIHAQKQGRLFHAQSKAGKIAGAISTANLHKLAQDSVGLLFNSWQVIDPDLSYRAGKAYILCKCVCGKQAQIDFARLRRLDATSCKSCAKK